MLCDNAYDANLNYDGESDDYLDRTTTYVSLPANVQRRVPSYGIDLVHFHSPQTECLMQFRAEVCVDIIVHIYHSIVRCVADPCTDDRSTCLYSIPARQYSHYKHSPKSIEFPLHFSI